MSRSWAWCARVCRFRARAREISSARAANAWHPARSSGKGAAHRLETALDVRHLRANRVVALRSAHEGAVLLQRHLLLPASRALPVRVQELGLAVQTLHRVAQKIAQVRVVHVPHRAEALAAGDARAAG